MIYIFNGAKTICALPGKLCSAIGDLCGQISCAPIKECCDAASKGCMQFTDKPLSSFVIIAWIMSGLELYYAYSALSGGWTETCHMGSAGGAPVGSSSYLYLVMGFAVVNALFAPYFQHQVWRQIMAAQMHSGLPLHEGSKIEKNAVVDAFKHVFMYDFGVLFYFFCLMASFCWCYFGGSWMQAAGCDRSGDAGWAYYMGLLFFWVAAIYACCWYCCSCCASSVQLSTPP
eukprot:CAMPEP_0206472588 /NCGR_PEP_ID=MMETSP0324_2-20121206/32297_1 /ASSEMBLY_ACC=CAM_ASM_000836 /TAXON_ID=2866 /ORGANISM="Crypthecodinium cohnii, Strain Seligo" /LENGTH=229 /DNA_ID=CAMNT_0053947231 /DNA_START=144 /DNA_END=833 /DNA_ORIENTATION=-